MLSLLEISLVWIEDDEGTSMEKLSKNNKVCELKGSWVDIHDKPVSFNARRFHKIEPHEGHMWALAAYTPQSFRRCSHEVCLQLEELGFPLHNRKTLSLTTKRIKHN